MGNDRDLAELEEDGDDLCRFLSAEECQEMEDSFHRMAQKTRARIIQGQKNGGLRKFNTRSSSNGQPVTLKTLVILVAWSDQTERIDWISRDDVDRLWNGEGTDTQIIPTGSIKYYTEEQAYGTVKFEATVIDWQVTDNTEAYYADGRFGMPKNGDRTPHLREAFHHVLNQMDEQNFPWGDYDSDNDGIIDSMQFMHSGYGAEYGGRDCYSLAGYEDRIWSHAVPEGQGKWTSAKTGHQLGGFASSSVFRSTCNKNIARLGVTMHEMYHTLGLPDLYDRDQPYSGQSGRRGLGGIGIFDMMASPFGLNNNQMQPGSLSPWSKLEMGFVKEPIEITESGYYTARPSNDYPDIYAIKRGYPEKEMLLLENRQAKGHDETLPAGGMLIFKIDGTIYYNGNRKHGFPGQTNAPEDGQSWPSNGLHYPVALLQADGNYDLEQSYNNGEAEDFYNSPDQVLGPGNGEYVATDQGTYPNTDSYVDGVIKVTGTVIDDFRESPEGSGIFTFRVTFAEEPTAAPTNKPTKAPTNKPTNKPTKSPTNKPTLRPSNNPTSNPTMTPTSSPTKAPTPVTESDCGHVLQVSIITDDKPHETTWEIISVATGEYLTGYRSEIDLEPARSLEPYTEYGWKVCVIAGDESKFQFTINDTGRDGLNGPGKYSLSLDGNLIGTGGPFADTTSTSIEFDVKDSE